MVTPVKVLGELPERVNVPAPFLVRMPEPVVIAPLISVLPDPVTMRLLPEPLTPPLMVSRPELELDQVWLAPRAMFALMVWAAEVLPSVIPPEPIVRVLLPVPLAIVTLLVSAVVPEPVKVRLAMEKLPSRVVDRLVALLAVKKTFETPPPGI